MVYVGELLPNLIMVCADEPTLLLTILINQSFEEGVFKHIVKTAILEPIHKKGEKHNIVL